MFDLPFRWDVTNRSRLGGLAEGERAASYPEFTDHLLACCSKVVASAGDADLVFVGRSPESVFDHLSGLLFDTPWFDRLVLLHFSMRFKDEAEIRQEYPAAIAAMRAYLRSLDLHPEGVATRSRPAAFIDLACTGDTFGRLVTLLHNWAEEIVYDWSAVRRRVRIIGITERTKTSPKTWRWQQHAVWVPVLGSKAIKNVSVPAALWQYLGNYQYKVSRSYQPSNWGDPGMASPSYEDWQLKGLRLAHDLFESGRDEERRERFAALLVKERAMKYEWYRKLVRQVRRQPGA